MLTCLMQLSPFHTEFFNLVCIFCSAVRKSFVVPFARVASMAAIFAGQLLARAGVTVSTDKAAKIANFLNIYIPPVLNDCARELC